MLKEKIESVSVAYSNVTKKFGEKVVVNNFSIDIDPGEYIIFLGPSGCGKTTSLRMLAGLETPTSGDVFINGECVTRVTPKDRDIAMVFQNYALYPHMTIKQNLAFPLEAKKTDKEYIEQRIKEVSSILGIEDHLEKRPAQLSGGEAQRVALGRALIRKPAVFLMDEPLSNLDAKLRNDMREEFLRLHNKLKITTIYVTHDQEEAMALADRIVLFNRGVVQQIGNPQEVYDKPLNKFVAEFLGNPKINMLKGLLSTDGTFEVENLGTDDNNIKIKIDSLQHLVESKKSVWIGIRPEDLSLAQTDESNYFANTQVEIIEPMGKENRICTKLGDWKIVLVDPQKNKFKVDDKVEIFANRDKFHVYDVETENRLN